MDLPKLWELTQQAWGPLTRRYEAVLETHCKAEGFDRRTWGLLLTVLSFEPEDTTPGHMMVRGPYTSADAYMNRLEQAAEKGLLMPKSPGAFSLTDRGRKLVNNMVEAARKEMADCDPMAPADSQRLGELAFRLVKASLEASPPPDPWSIQLSYKLLPAEHPPMPYIEQAFSCLAAYRDDAHLAAWQRSGLSAMALETLTVLWNGEATSLDDLCSKLAHREHDCRVYVTVLEELRKAGYLHGPDQAPSVTGAGRVFRNQVEADTDRYFFTPWACLKAGERKELAGLLERMRDGLLESMPNT